MANKNAELQRLTGIYKNILKNAGVTLIEGRGKVRFCCKLNGVNCYMLLSFLWYFPFDFCVINCTYIFLSL